MKVVLVHNYLRSSGPSGENLTYQDERNLLRKYGHEVVEFTVSNDDLEGSRWKGSLRAAFAAPWSFSTVSRLREVLGRERPQVVHVHNTFPLLSPAVFYAARGLPCATVLTLHNYRIFCAAGVPLRDGRPCIECLEKHSSLSALRYRCYRGSRVATLPLSLSVALHRLLGTWREQVDAFVCLSDFQLELMARAGLPQEILFVKPHCYLGAPSPRPWEDRDDKVVFLGRLGPEKGVSFLLEAWRKWGRLGAVARGDWRGAGRSRTPTGCGGGHAWRSSLVQGAPALQRGPGVGGASEGSGRAVDLVRGIPMVSGRRLLTVWLWWPHASGRFRHWSPKASTAHCSNPGMPLTCFPSRDASGPTKAR